MGIQDGQGRQEEDEGSDVELDPTPADPCIASKAEAQRLREMQTRAATLCRPRVSNKYSRALFAYRVLSTTSVVAVAPAILTDPIPIPPLFVVSPTEADKVGRTL